MTGLGWKFLQCVGICRVLNICVSGHCQMLAIEEGVRMCVVSVHE